MSRRLAVQATGLFTRSGGRPRHSQTHQPGMTLQSVCIEQPSVLVESRNFCPGRPGTAVPGPAPLGDEDPLQNGGGPSNEIGFGFRVSFEQRIRDTQRPVGASSSDPMARSPVTGSVPVLALSSLAGLASAEA
jgi:hypothetical protein